MNEDVFLRTIQEKPNDDTTRLIYADWLDEQGDEASAARAAFIRADCELAALAEKDKRRTVLLAHRRQLARRLDGDWLAVVSKLPIEKCSFAFECPKRWENLQAVADVPNLRFCSECQQNVYHCHTIEEARDHAWQGHCVAVAAALSRKKGDLEVRMLMGRIRPPS
jgi:uncharacterized protein (TIGR02996 family)